MDCDDLGYRNYSEDPFEDIDGQSSSHSDIDSELEIALYSQIHFEQNPEVPSTDRHASNYIIEEEIPQVPDPEVHWRERLLEGNFTNTNKSLIGQNVESAKVNKTLESKLDDIIIKAKKTPCGKASSSGFTATNKTSESKTRPDISSFLLRKEEPENKKLESKRLGSKNLKNKTSTPKSRPAVTVTEEMSDSSIDILECSISDMIVIDSITDTDASIADSTKKGDIIEISDSDDENMFRVKKVSYTSDESTDSSICEVDVATDIQLNTRGFRQVEKRTPKRVSLENAELEDFTHLSVEDIHNSLPACEWNLSIEDRFTPSSKAASRYFRPINVKCHNCKERGHLSKICPQPKKIPVCILCGLEGHISRSCPSKVCYNCFHIGHSRDSCSQSKRHPFARCERCYMKGHRENECTDIWRQYHMTTKPGTVEKVRKKVNSRKFCYNCATRGHFGYECKEETMDYYRPPQYTHISVYGSEPLHENYGQESWNEGPPMKTSRAAKRKKRIAKNREEAKMGTKKGKKKTNNSAFVQSALDTSKKKSPRRRPRTRKTVENIFNGEEKGGGSHFSSSQTSGKASRWKRKRSDYEGDFIRSAPQHQQTGGKWKKKGEKRRNEHDANTRFQKNAKRARYRGAGSQPQYNTRGSARNSGSFTSGRGFTSDVSRR